VAADNWGEASATEASPSAVDVLPCCVNCGRSEESCLALEMPGVEALFVCVACLPPCNRVLRAASRAGWLRRDASEADGARFAGAGPSDTTVPEATVCVSCDGPVTREAGAGLFQMPGSDPLWACVSCQPRAGRFLVAASRAGWFRVAG
jgi:hypothetical protein